MARPRLRMLYWALLAALICTSGAVLAIGKVGKTRASRETALRQASLQKGKPKALAGTFLVAQIDAANSRVRLMDVVERAAVPTTGTFDAVKAKVATYKLVGPDYFYFFVIVMGIGGIVFQ